MHYYKRNIGDYAKKAARLTMLQHGAYTLLMDACYDRERFPTADEALDWTWASSTAEIEAVEFVLRKFFTLHDGVYVQERVREEIEAYQQKAEKNRRIAVERETKRREKRTSRATKSTKRTPSVNGTSPDDHEAPPNQEPRTINQEPRTMSTTPSTETADEADYHKAAIAMWEKIQPIKKRDNKPNLEIWAKHIRHLVELDHIDPETVWRVFEWANRDPFWRPNILSPQKLREKFDTLYAKMTSEADHGPHRQKTGNRENPRRLSAVERVKRARYGGGA